MNDTTEAWIVVQMQWFFKNGQFEGDIIFCHLNDMLTPKQVPYQMRDSSLLEQSRCRTTTFGLRSISYIGAKLWNDLPSYFKETTCLNLQTWTGPDLNDPFRSYVWAPSDSLYKWEISFGSYIESRGALVCMCRMCRSVHRDMPSVFVCIGMGARACNRHIPNVPIQTCRHIRDKMAVVAVSLATILL